MSGYPVLVSCRLVFFDSGGLWGHQDAVSARVAPASHWFPEGQTPQDVPKTPQDAIFSGSDAHPGLLFLALFFDFFWNLFLLDFPSQLGNKKQPKSIKNRCQHTPYLGLQFLIDCYSSFAPNFYPRNLKNRAPAAARARFLKKSQFAIGIDF